jgi:hypothetical protein
MGQLSSNLAAPLVQSRRTSLEKPPWKDIPSLRGNVEAQFVRPLYLGESIVPFRVVEPILAVIPWDEQHNRLIDASQAQLQGYLHLAEWLGQVEHFLKEYGRGRRTMLEQLDYYGQLSAQFPISEVRVAYTASGTLPAVAVVRDQRAVVEHKLYWTSVSSNEEAVYLLAVLNSETARARTEHLQSRGQWGARDFDKVMLSLPIPKHDATEPLHRELARAARRAEEVAASVSLEGIRHFVTARRRIGEVLREDGVAQEMDNMVAQLLG